MSEATGWQRKKEVFGAALERPAEERDAFVAGRLATVSRPDSSAWAPLARIRLSRPLRRHRPAPVRRRSSPAFLATGSRTLSVAATRRRWLTCPEFVKQESAVAFRSSLATCRVCTKGGAPAEDARVGDDPSGRASAVRARLRMCGFAGGGMKTRNRIGRRSQDAEPGAGRRTPEPDAGRRNRTPDAGRRNRAPEPARVAEWSM